MNHRAPVMAGGDICVDTEDMPQIRNNKKNSKTNAGILPAGARLLCAQRPTGDRRTRLLYTDSTKNQSNPGIVWKTRISQVNEVFVISSLNFIRQRQGNDLSNRKYFQQLFFLY